MEKSELSVGTVTAKITSDFIIDLYKEAQDLKGDEKDAMLATIDVLRKHIGEFLTSDVTDVDDIMTE